MKRLFQFFTKRHLNKVPDKDKSSSFMKVRQQKLADFLNRKAASLPRRTIVLLFTAFCLLSAGYYSYILARCLNGKPSIHFQIGTINKPLNIPEKMDSLSQSWKRKFKQPASGISDSNYSPTK